MLLNEGKFELIHFGKEAGLKQPYSPPSGEPLTASVTIRDLGVIVDDQLNWSAHINVKVDMARRMSSWILRTFRSRGVRFKVSNMFIVSFSGRRQKFEWGGANNSNVDPFFSYLEILFT